MAFFTTIYLCSDCFKDSGLRREAEQLGFKALARCPRCKSRTSKKLNADAISRLVRRFFIEGSYHPARFGGAPQLAANALQDTSVDFTTPLSEDVALLSNLLGVGFFHYGPRLWMLGQIEPLEALEQHDSRDEIVSRIVSEYPEMSFDLGRSVYRLRSGVKDPTQESEFDAPPVEHSGNGRLDTRDHPVLYASEDIQVCLHECRVAVGDVLHLSTLTATKTLKLLNLSAVLQESRELSEFQRLDLAVYMLFLAGPHSYEISRAISLAALKAGFDGIVYPSYFSMLRTNSMPFETIFGLSFRRVPRFHEYEVKKIVGNLAFFGRPIADAKLKLTAVNRLLLRQTSYQYSFGPVFRIDEPGSEETEFDQHATGAPFKA